MPEVIDFDQLDALLTRAEALIPVDYTAAMDLLTGVTVDLRSTWGSGDPFAPEYAAWVMATYEKVAAVAAYDPPEHEADRNVRPDLPLTDFFPFCTRDTRFIGRYLSGVGMVVAELNLPPGSRIIEYGVGWGHVAAALARAGHHVTCVDIEATFLDLARRQGEALGCRIETHHGRFGDRPYPPDAPDADAVVFFEAFHHAFDHRDVLRRLRRDVLRPGGVLVLAAEPIDQGFPVPWGIRSDGHALWAVRRHKWMELGFREDYLLRALLREGFLVTRTHVEALGSFGLLYRAVLHEGTVRPGETLLPQPEAASWAPAAWGGEPRRWAQMDSRATLDHDPCWTGITVGFFNYLPIPLEATVDVGGVGPAICHRFVPGERVTLRLTLPPTGRELRVWSETAVPAQLGVNGDTRNLGIALEDLTYDAL